MHPDQIFVIILASLVTGCITLGMFAQAWGASRRQPKAPEASLRLEAIEARLARMEEMLDAAAVELERVAEAQRFTAKLLAERALPDGQASATRAQQAELRRITPH